MRGITVFAILISVIALSAFVIEQNDESCTAKSRNSRKSAGPPPYYTGEPPEYASCGAAGCHDGVTSTTNTGPGIATLDLGEANDGFELGKSYTITISLSRSGMVRSGFQIIALLDDYEEYSPGTFALIDTNRTQIRDKSNVSWGCCWENRVWIEHKFDGITPIADDYNEWQYYWTSPAQNEGNITFYLAINDADGDLTDTMDYNYTITKTIAFAPPDTTDTNTTSIANHFLLKNQLIISPNPVNDVGRITYMLINPGNVLINVYDMSGKKVDTIVNEWKNKGLHEQSFSVEKLESGIFLLQVMINNDSYYSGKLIKLE